MCCLPTLWGYISSSLELKTVSSLLLNASHHHSSRNFWEILRQLQTCTTRLCSSSIILSEVTSHILLRQLVSSPRWLFGCCGRWRKAVHWGLSSSPSLGAGSSAVSCAGTWGNCRGMAEETGGWRTCPSRPSVPGYYLLPGEKMEKQRKQSIILPVTPDCTERIKDGIQYK